MTIEELLNACLHTGTGISANIEAGMASVHLWSDPYTSEWYAIVNWSDRREVVAKANRPQEALEKLQAALAARLEEVQQRATSAAPAARVLTPRTEGQLQQAAFDGQLAVGMTHVSWFSGSKEIYDGPSQLIAAYKHETPKIVPRPGAACWAVYLKPHVELSAVCDRPDCGQPAVARIFINVWGTLCEHDVCRLHMKRHGAWCDSL
jgi:hypothetical protein